MLTVDSMLDLTPVADLFGRGAEVWNSPKLFSEQGLPPVRGSDQF